MSAIEIRPATVDDAGPIAAVHVRSWQEAYRGQLPQALLDGLSVERRTTQVRDMLSAPQHGMWVAIEDGQVVGFASVGDARDADTTPDTGELYAIYLAPQAWGIGVGRALHDTAVTALATNYAEAILWVLETNARARRFYERQGWVTDGARKEEQRGDAVLEEVRYRRALEVTSSR